MAPHIVFVCTGNICRSPLAEVAARKQFGHLSLEFGSAGLRAAEGLPASVHSCVVAESWGSGLAGHGSRQVTPELAGRASWLIGMTRSHAVMMRGRLADLADCAIGWLGAPGLDVRQVRHTPAGPEVDDPYGGEPALYEAAGRKIWELIAGWESVFIDLAADKGDTP